MTTEDRAYFIAEGEAADICAAFMKERSEAREEWCEIGERLGAKNVWSNGRTLKGFSFDEAPTRADGWRQSSDGRFYVPLRSTREGKNLAKLIDDAPKMPTADSLTQRLGCSQIMLPSKAAGFKIVYVGLERLSDKWIVSVPLNSDGKHETPANCTPIMRSEYWRMKERAEAA